jgi:hypothetical protein
MNHYHSDDDEFEKGHMQDAIEREKKRADDAEQRLASMAEAHDQQREGWCRCLLELSKVSDALERACVDRSEDVGPGSRDEATIRSFAARFESPDNETSQGYLIRLLDRARAERDAARSKLSTLNEKAKSVRALDIPALVSANVTKLVPGASREVVERAIGRMETDVLMNLLKAVEAAVALPLTGTSDGEEAS